MSGVGGQCPHSTHTHSTNCRTRCGQICKQLLLIICRCNLPDLSFMGCPTRRTIAFMCVPSQIKGAIKALYPKPKSLVIKVIPPPLPKEKNNCLLSSCWGRAPAIHEAESVHIHSQFPGQGTWKNCTYPWLSSENSIWLQVSR